MDTPLLDLDLLNTLVAIADLGGFAKAGVRVGRTQSAVSLQMQRLEELAGQKLFVRKGRTQGFTEAGHTLVHYSRRMLALNGETVGILGHAALAGTVRLGTSQDVAEAWLAPVLGGFASQFPSVRLECRVENSATLAQAVKNGDLDLALTLHHGQHAGVELLGDLQLIWIGPQGKAPNPGQAMPLALLNPPCEFRDQALRALDQAGIPWRIVFSSLSVSALWAAVRAGLGWTVRTRVGLPQDLRIHSKSRLPPLGRTQVALHRAPGGLSPAAVRLSEMLAVHLRKRLRAPVKTR
jgi:DNA-binding transcriptional LysR family regulator